MLGASQPDDEQTNTKGARFNLNQGYLEGDKCDNNANLPRDNFASPLDPVCNLKKQNRRCARI